MLHFKPNLIDLSYKTLDFRLETTPLPPELPEHPVFPHSQTKPRQAIQKPFPKTRSRLQPA